MDSLTFQPAHRMAALIRNKEVSPRELLDAHLRQIEKLNPKLNAIIHLDLDRARRQAQAAEQAVMNGRKTGPLHGVPVTIKSSIDVEGLLCECGSRLREGHVAERDATLVARLKSAGAVILGNTNVPDLLVAYETDNLLYGRTNNPWYLDRTSGGSSGGEAAAIASGCSAAGFGSDGGGSIRVPAHCCGIYGLKPTLGLIPRTGHWPESLGPSSLLASIGPLARSVDDLELLLQVTGGLDYQDASSLPSSCLSDWRTEAERIKVGWFDDNGIAPVTSDTRQAVRKAGEMLQQQGFIVEPFELQGMETARDHWWTLFGISGAAALKPLIEGREKDLHPIVQDLLAAPEDPLEATFTDLLGAWMARDQLRAKLLADMQRYRVLLCPVGSVPAFRHGERSWRIDEETVTYSRAFTYCQIFNLLGNPSIAVPAGRSAEGLPIGIQVVGRPYEDSLILAIARKLEEALGGCPMPPLQG